MKVAYRRAELLLQNELFSFCVYVFAIIATVPNEYINWDKEYPNWNIKKGCFRWGLRLKMQEKSIFIISCLSLAFVDVFIPHNTLFSCPN